MIQEAIQQLIGRSDLSREQAREVMEQIMTGSASDAANPPNSSWKSRDYHTSAPRTMARYRRQISVAGLLPNDRSLPFKNAGSGRCGCGRNCAIRNRPVRVHS